MTPRDQIQEHAKIAADKVRAAMVEFAAATGMQAQAHTAWLTIHSIDSATPENICTDVTLRYEDEVRA